MLWLGLCFSFSDKLLILGQENLSAKLIRGLTTLLLLLSSPAVLSLSLLQAEDVGGWVSLLGWMLQSLLATAVLGTHQESALASSSLPAVLTPFWRRCHGGAEHTPTSPIQEPSVFNDLSSLFFFLPLSRQENFQHCA